MNWLKKAVGLILQSRVLTVTTVGFVSMGTIGGALFFPENWHLLLRILLGFGAGLMATLYAVGNHLLMEMNDSVNEVAQNRERVESSPVENTED